MMAAKIMTVLAISALLLGESPLVIGGFASLAWLFSRPVDAVGSPSSGW